MDNIINELEKLRNEVANILQKNYSERGDFIPSIIGRIDRILETPKRNCDIGTVDEQIKMFYKFCIPHKCTKCPLCVDGEFIGCGVRWSQMPYEKGESNEQ